jgi:hypothetical protein
MDVGEIMNNGTVYEDMCARYLAYRGYTNIRKTPASNDHGIDIIASKNGITYGIQCKYYEGSVGSHAVMEAYAGKPYYGVDVAVVMTNSVFTPSAIAQARADGVQLWDHQNAHIPTEIELENARKRQQQAQRIKIYTGIGMIIAILANILIFGRLISKFQFRLYIYTAMIATTSFTVGMFYIAYARTNIIRVAIAKVLFTFSATYLIGNIIWVIVKIM